MDNRIKLEINKHFKKLISICLMVTICTVSAFSVGTLSRKVDVKVDNEEKSAITVNTDTDKILQQLGVVVGENDFIERFEDPSGIIKLEVKRAFEVTVRYGKDAVKVRIASGCVKDAVAASGFLFGENDETNLPGDETLVPGMEIEIIRRVKVKIASDGGEKESFVPCGTVSDAVAYAQVALSTEDIVNVDVSSEVYEGMQIVINRVTYRENTRVEEIPFNTVTKRTTLLSDGKQEISTEGRNGEKVIELKETLVDGKVIKSEEIGSRVTREPVDKVVLVGTKEAPSTKNESSSSDTNKNQSGLTSVNGYATAYTAKSGARTSTGKTPVNAVTMAVNPKVFPYGSKLSVKAADGSFEYVGIAQDTGGFIRTHPETAVDIYFDSYDKCIKFGKKKVQVTRIS